MLNAGNMFNNTGMDIVGNIAAPDQAKTANEVTPVKQLKWFESPLMFIGVIILMLVTMRFVERKVI